MNDWKPNLIRLMSAKELETPEPLIIKSQGCISIIIFYLLSSTINTKANETKHKHWQYKQETPMKVQSTTQKS